MDLELRQLRYFVAVAEELSYRRAAERLLLTEPALSRQVARLEGALGVSLLARSRRHVELTPAGALLLEHARRILADVDVAANLVSESARGKVGLLRIRHTSLGVCNAAHVCVSRFRERYPRVMLDVSSAYTARNLDDLQRYATFPAKERLSNQSPAS